MVYDPSRTSYADLLQVYASTHTPRRSAGQYRSIVFFADDSERAIAHAYAARMATAPELVSTTTEQGQFWSAEAYHQKYRLRRKPTIVRSLQRRIGDRWDEHTLATKLNASGPEFDMSPWLDQLSAPAAK